MAFASVSMVGGNGGETHNCYGGTNGKLLTKIGVWATESTVKALRVTLTDDEPITFGKSGENDTYKEYSFSDGEVISKLSLWGNGEGSRLGWILMETSSGGKLDHGMTKWGKHTEYPMEVASGICAGVIVGAGADIDRLGFVFMSSIASSTITSLKYPTLAFKTEGISPQTLDSFTDHNTGHADRGWTFSGSQMITSSHVWSGTVGLTTHITTTISAGVPEVSNAKGEFGWEVSATKTFTSTYEEKLTLTWGESGSLKPGTSISLKAVTRKGDLSIPYEGIVNVTTHSGESYHYPIKGQYHGVTYTSVSILDK